MVGNTGLLLAFKETRILFSIVTRELSTHIQNIPVEVQNLLNTFGEICSAELPPGLSLMRDIQH